MDRGFFTDNILSRVSSDLFGKLIEEFSESEIWEAVRDCDANKAPRA